MQMACEEREDFADFLDGLSPEQWEQPSLCELWRVRDVVAHVISYEELSRWQLVWRFAKGGFVPPRVNAIGVAEYVGRSPRQLSELMRTCIPPRGLTSAFGGMIALVDGMIHQQDIRRPLGIGRVIPPHRLQRVLEYRAALTGDTRRPESPGRAPGRHRLGLGLRRWTRGGRSGRSHLDGHGRTAGRAKSAERVRESSSGPTYLSGAEAYQSAGSNTDSAASTFSSTGSSSLRPHAATIRETTG